MKRSWMGVKFGIKGECLVEFLEGREKLVEERWECPDDFLYSGGARERVWFQQVLELCARCF
jgi:hypothetical protein